MAGWKPTLRFSGRLLQVDCTITGVADAVLNWLMEGDPSIRWQAMRHLKRAAERTFRREQRRVAETGWGAQLLALQDPDGRWASGIYNPKWTSTTYTMVLLRSLGLPAGDPGAMRACRLLLDTGFWEDGGINYWRRWRNSSVSGAPSTSQKNSPARWPRH